MSVLYSKSDVLLIVTLRENSFEIGCSLRGTPINTHLMLFTSFRDSWMFMEADGSLEIVFRRLSRLSLSVALDDAPLLALNDEQIDAFPKEL